MTSKQSKPKTSGKVGSSREDAIAVGGKNDFGKPLHQDVVRINEDDPIDRPAGSAIGAESNQGRRDVGVGSRGGSEGESSGGDLDPDFVGVAGGAGLAQSPADHVTKGPASTTGHSDEFASGGHAKGRNSKPKGAVGSGGPVKKGTTHQMPDAHTSREAASENFVDPQDTE